MTKPRTRLTDKECAELKDALDAAEYFNPDRQEEYDKLRAKLNELADEWTRYERRSGGV